MDESARAGRRRLRVAAASFGAILLWAAVPATAPAAGEALREYLRVRTAEIASRSPTEVETLEEWTAALPENRRRLAEMLGLWPEPDRTPLNARTTGRVEAEEFVVEKVVFESRPGLYVTGNLYLPKAAPGPLPAILYLCGHGRVKIDGVSYGNKTHYRHHGAWFARHGYVCLTIDTLQLGEIEGHHHGTHNLGMWWWNARGYTPAGVEAWNAIRSLDYLATRPEVDAERIGATGRSGGGIYSWWVAALDERVKVVVPVAGITDLENYVVDDCIEGHCDCMFMANKYMWDYPAVAALVAPRPLLIANTDKDRIFPLDGVERLHWKVRHIYELHGAGDNLGLLVTEGPHKDTQDLQVPAFRWFDRWLKEESRPIEKAAVPFFEPRDLKVLDATPEDELNTTIHESFVPREPEPAVPENLVQWLALRERLKRRLREDSFRAWPAEGASLELRRTAVRDEGGRTFETYEFLSQEGLRLPLHVARRTRGRPGSATLTIADEATWARLAPALAGGAAPDAAIEAELFPADDPRRVSIVVPPRGVGPTAWPATGAAANHIRRRFQLLGETIDSGRVWDARRAVAATREIADLKGLPLTLEGRGDPMAVVALYAAAFETGVERLVVRDLPRSHRDGPDFLNVLRFMDVDQAIALAADRCAAVVAPAGEGAPATIAAEAWPWFARLAATPGMEPIARNVRFETVASP